MLLIVTFLFFKTDINDPESLLLEFLYDNKAMDEYDIFFKMFITHFDLQATLAHHSSYIEEQVLEFNSLVEAR